MNWFTPLCKIKYFGNLPPAGASFERGAGRDLRGAAKYVIEGMLSGGFGKVLWGDIIHQNIRNYVERYFVPVLKPLPPSLWGWRATDKLLTVGAAV